MEIVFFLLVILGISIGVSYSVYKKEKKAGKNGWLWAIVTFLILFALLLGGIVLLLMFAFER